MNINKITSKIVSKSSELLKGKGAAKVDDVTFGIKTSGNVTNPLAPLAKDTVEFSALSKFEKSLESNYKKAPLEVTVDGKTENWSRYVYSQVGSQDAFFAKNNETGELFYVKFAETKAKEGHIESEILASKLYNLAGFETPEIKLITLPGGKKALASKYIPGLDDPTDFKSLHKGFAVDAWLANWDALQYGNTYLKNGKLIKLDNGGALRYRAMGKIKPNFGDKVDELMTFVDGTNSESRYIYSSISHEDLVNSFKQVCGISDKSIREVVKDKELAQTLINRKNYMSEFLEEMERTPKTNEKLVDYFSKISEHLAKKHSFNSQSILDNLSLILDSRIISNPQYLTMPSTKTLGKDLVFEIKQLEKRGVKVSKEDIVKLLQELASDGIEMPSSKIANHFTMACNMEEHYNRMFTNLVNIAEKTEPKDGESMSSYLSRVVKIRERKIKQLDDYRIKSIRAKLTYEPELKRPAATRLSPTERKAAIEELEAARKKDLILDIHTIPKLSENATDKQIYRAWQRGHMGAFEFSDNELQKSVMGIGGRYSSKQPIKTKTIYEAIADKDYKQEFEIEPVYHWFSMPNAEDFVKKQLPKKGEIYTIDQRQCCSTHKHYAEVDYGDHIPNQNIKFIMHPKSETSRAYNLGYNQEVVYPAGEQFRILDKECVEYIDPKSGSGCLRWEIHMQEV